MIKTLGLIPSRFGSKRLPGKALLPINKIPLIVHVYKRAKLSKKLNDLFVCCDDKKIFNAVVKYGGKALMTSTSHSNGTERIAEAYRMIDRKYDLVIDIQGDEPLIDPRQIDKVIDYHKKNFETDIIVPCLKIKKINNENIVKIVKDKKDNVLYFSRSTIPFNFKKRIFYLYKHLSIISFKPMALLKYSNFNQTYLEKIEGIELLRALEIGLKIKSPKLNGDSFSVDVLKDYLKAKARLRADPFLKRYINK